MKWILLLAFWTDGRLEANGYEYAEKATCEQVARHWTLQAQMQDARQVIEIWCYPVRGEDAFASTGAR